MDAVVTERWRAERRERILSAASRVFARQSFEQASMDALAREAGVGKPTLYRYFAGKDALFSAVFIDALDRLEHRLDLALGGQDGVASQLPALVLEIVPMFRDHLVSLRLLGETAAAVDRSKRRIFRERRARIGSFLARAVEDGIRRGELRPIDPHRTAQLIIGMIWSGTATAESGDRDIAREICDLVLNGALAHRPAAPNGGRPRAQPDLPLSAGDEHARHEVVS